MLEFLDLYAIAKANNRDGRYDTFIQPIKNGRFFRPPRPATPDVTRLNTAIYTTRRAKSPASRAKSPMRRENNPAVPPKDCANRQT